MVASAIGIAASVWVVLEVIYGGGPGSLVRMLIGAVIAWRLLGVAVYIDGSHLVSRNVIGTDRFPLDEVDIRPSVVDIRQDMPWVPPTTNMEDVPMMEDDNTPQSAKRYVLVHDGELHNLDALIGRMPLNHEKQALELRKEILRARREG